MKVRIHLYGGACDGWRKEVDTFDQPKLIYFMWPGHLADVEKLRSSKAREARRKSLENLAYRFVGIDHSKLDGVLELRYQRFPRKDKRLPVPCNEGDQGA